MDENIEIVLADEFVKNFPTMESFRDWCEDLSIEELDDVRRIFEAYELYEHCATVKDVMNKKDD